MLQPHVFRLFSVVLFEFPSFKWKHTEIKTSFFPQCQELLKINGVGVTLLLTSFNSGNLSESWLWLYELTRKSEMFPIAEGENQDSGDLMKTRASKTLLQKEDHLQRRTTTPSSLYKQVTESIWRHFMKGQWKMRGVGCSVGDPCRDTGGLANRKQIAQQECWHCFRSQWDIQEPMFTGFQKENRKLLTCFCMLLEELLI